MSAGLEDWAAEEAAKATHESKRILKRVIGSVCCSNDTINCRLKSVDFSLRAARISSISNQQLYKAHCSPESRSAQSSKRQVDARLQRSPSIDHGLRQADGFEPRSYFQVKLEVSIACGMRSQRAMFLQSLPGHFLAAHALDNAPTLLQPSGRIQHIIDLVAPRERPSVEKKKPRSIPLQQVACGLKHHFQTEIILPGRVFDLIRRKQRVSDLIFAEHAPSRADGQFAGEGSLAGARKARHQNDHVE